MEKVYGTIKISDGRTKSFFCYPEEYDLKHYKFTCKLCGSKNDYWMQEGCYPYQCQSCQDTGKIPDYSQITLHMRRIPSWRLKVDDASEEEVLNGTHEDFGIQPQSYEKWMDYYENSPHEVQKSQELKKDKEIIAKEMFG